MTMETMQSDAMQSVSAVELEQVEGGIAPVLAAVVLCWYLCTMAYVAGAMIQDAIQN